MSRVSAIVHAIAYVFAGVNIAGAGFAIAEKEPSHAGVHVALGALGLIVGWAVRLRETRQRRLREAALEAQLHDAGAALAEAEARLAQLGVPVRAEARALDAAPARVR